MTPTQIKRLMKKLGMTQQQLADAIDAHPVTIADWTRGASKPRGLYLKALRSLAAKVEMIARLTELIGIVDDVMKFDPERLLTQRRKSTIALEAIFGEKATVLFEMIDSTDSRTTFCMGMGTALIGAKKMIETNSWPKGWNRPKKMRQELQHSY